MTFKLFRLLPPHCILFPSAMPPLPGAQEARFPADYLIKGAEVNQIEECEITRVLDDVDGLLQAHPRRRTRSKEWFMPFW